MTALSQNASEWMNVEAPPENTSGSVALLNEKEFVTFVTVEDEDTIVLTLQKYNVDDDQWTLLIKLPSLTGHEADRALVIDCVTNRAYIVGRYSVMTIVDLTTNSVIFHLGGEDGEGSSLANANGIVYRIGNWFLSGLVTWNETEQNWNSSVLSKGQEFGHFSDVSMVHVPSKNIILMIGGATCKLDEYGGPGEEARPLGIWKFSLENQMWRNMKVKGSERLRSDCQSMICFDEQYVIIYSRERENIGSFHVLDIRDDDNYKMWESRIKPPKGPGIGKIAISLKSLTSQALIRGTIRKVFGSFPEVLVALINSYSSTEMLHYLYYYSLRKNGHCTIPMKCVLAINDKGCQRVVKKKKTVTKKKKKVTKKKKTVSKKKKTTKKKKRTVSKKKKTTSKKNKSVSKKKKVDKRKSSKKTSAKKSAKKGKK